MWTRLSDDFPDRVEIAGLSDAAFRVHVEALCFCNRLLTDGRLPKSVVGRVLTHGAAPEVYAELVKAGLWVDEPEHFYVEWRDQLNAEEVEQRRALNRERSERSRRHKAQDHSMCRPSYCPYVTRDVPRDQTRHSRVSDGVSDALPSLPVPSLPDPSRPLGREGEGEGETAGQPAAPAEAGPPAAGPGRETRGGQMPAEPPADVEARLGRKRHRWAPDCCALTERPDHPIHDM